MFLEMPYTILHTVCNIQSRKQDGYQVMSLFDKMKDDLVRTAFQILKNFTT